MGVELAPIRVIGEMVLDGGEHFIPADIFGLHTLRIIISSQAAHDRTTEVTHQYKRHTHLYTRHLNTLNVGTVHKTRQEGIDFVPL